MSVYNSVDRSDSESLPAQSNHQPSCGFSILSHVSGTFILMNEAETMFAPAALHPLLFIVQFPHVWSQYSALE